MQQYFVQFASAEPATGIGALGLDVRSFIFQLITFLLVVAFLKKYAINKLYAVIDARRKEIADGLERAELAKKQLELAGLEADQIVGAARVEADAISKEARAQAATEVAKIEQKAQARAERIVAESREQLSGEVEKAEAELKKRSAQFVSQATERVLQAKLQGSIDEALIRRTLAELEAEGIQ